MVARANPTERKLALAALKLAERKPWQDVTLNEIARAARVSAQQARRLFPDTMALLPALVRLIDSETAKTLDVPEPDAPPHDRLFEVMMARFDALKTRRAGILSVAAACRKTPAHARTMLRAQWDSMRFMLRLANLDAEGWPGMARTAGLTGVYNLTLCRWMRDETPDMAKTMSALDRNLQCAGQAALLLFDDRKPTRFPS
jgi:AcrR family transcriptional regulator